MSGVFVRTAFFRAASRLIPALGLLSFQSIGLAQAAPAAGANAPQSHLQIAGMRVSLVKSLDTGKLQPGDPVMARPEVAVRMANGVEFQPSTVLVGHVDEVHRSESRSDAAVTLTFDKAQMKKGSVVAIKATILWIAPAPNLMHPTATTAPVDRATPGAGVLAGQSVIPPAAANAYNGVLPDPAKDRGQAGSASPQNAPPPGTFRQQDGIPGVSLESSIQASYSGTLRAVRHNVSLPEGTVMALAVVVLGN